MLLITKLRQTTNLSLNLAGAKISVKIACNLLASGQRLHLAFQHVSQASDETGFLMAAQNVFLLAADFLQLP